MAKPYSHFSFKLNIFMALVLLGLLVFIGYQYCSSCMGGCMLPPAEGFQVNLFAPPENVILITDPTKKNARLDFSAPDILGKLPTNYIVVLGKYTTDLKFLGDMKFNISKETDGIERSICKMVGGRTLCSYEFKNLDNFTADGQPILYKVGVAAVYDDDVSNFVEPSNLSNEFKYFSISKSLDAQRDLYTRAKKLEEAAPMGMDATVLDNTLIGPDGTYEMIKNQLGGYPDALFIETQDVGTSTLADLVDKSMSVGAINVNVK